MAWGRCPERVKLKLFLKDQQELAKQSRLVGHPGGRQCADNMPGVGKW